MNDRRTGFLTRLGNGFPSKRMRRDASRSPQRGPRREEEMKERVRRKPQKLRPLFTRTRWSSHRRIQPRRCILFDSFRARLLLVAISCVAFVSCARRAPADRGRAFGAPPYMAVAIYKVHARIFSTITSQESAVNSRGLSVAGISRGNYRSVNGQLVFLSLSLFLSRGSSIFRDTSTICERVAGSAIPQDEQNN